MAGKLRADCQNAKRSGTDHLDATSLPRPSHGLHVMIEQTLDPFGYWPGRRSRVRDLGGPQKAEDPNYVFHTSYVTVPPGPSLAEVSFDGLAAETGMIAVRIFQHLASGIPAVTEQGRMTALLPSIAKTRRSIKVPFEALPDATYAVTGYVFGECEARAKSIDIVIAPRPTEAEDPTRARSMFGRLRGRYAGGLAASEAPRLAWPVSQGFTQEQTQEADFARLAVGSPPALPVSARWEAAYILRVLEQYGRLERGARGLAIATTTDEAAAHAITAGSDVHSIVLLPNETIADGCARQIPDSQEGRGFDFLWARSDVSAGAGSARILGQIEDLLERLRPGGLAIYLVTAGGPMDRHALNRIALGIVALGHIVAQLRYPPDDAAPAPFGFVVRKSTDDIIT